MNAPFWHWLCIIDQRSRSRHLQATSYQAIFASNFGFSFFITRYGLDENCAFLNNNLELAQMSLGHVHETRSGQKRSIWSREFQCFSLKYIEQTCILNFFFRQTEKRMDKLIPIYTSILPNIVYGGINRNASMSTLTNNSFSFYKYFQREKEDIAGYRLNMK